MNKTIKKCVENIFFDHNKHNLVFRFDTQFWNDKLDNKLLLDIFFENNEDNLYKCIEIFSTSPCNVKYSFKNGISIAGTLEIRKSSVFDLNDTLGVFADLHYYIKEKTNYIWHTEGFIASFNPEDIPIVDEIEIENEFITDEVIRDEVETIDNIATAPVTSNAYIDLFPYIHLSELPKSSTSEQSWNFFKHKPSSNDTSFYKKLALLKSNGKRQLIHEEAIKFIEGTSYENHYVADLYSLEGYISKFELFYNSLRNKKELSQIVEETFLYFDTDIDDFSRYLKSDSYLENKERLWETYFALIIEMGYDNQNLTSITKVLTLCNFLENIFNNQYDTPFITTIGKKKLDSLFNATIILDKNVFPLPPYTLITAPQVNFILPYAIGDLQLVKYKLSRYEVGELASVISIMPGEKRKLVNRKLDRVIDKEVSEIISVTESVNSTNYNNNSFKEELWNTIAETTETTNYPDPGLVSSYGPPTNITITGSSTKTHTTQKPDNKNLSSFAIKILNKTTQRFSEKVNKVRAHTELKEQEDTSVSFINNTNNEEPAYGIYCWLNKIYKTKVINYGNRMLYSFKVDNPAASYIKQTQILSSANVQTLKSLEELGISAYTDIIEDNYLRLAHYYNLKEFPLYPQDNIIISDIVSLSETKLIALPDSYCADKATIKYAFGSAQKDATVDVCLGQNKFSFNQKDAKTGEITDSQLKNEQGSIVFSVVSNSDITDFTIGISISCIPLSQTILAWKIEFYQLLDEAYLIQVDPYNLKMETSNPLKGHVNALAERRTVKLELEKDIRKQLLQNALQVKGLSVDEANKDLNATMEYNQPEIIQYLNAALEWNEMSYTFFDGSNNANSPDNHFSVSSLSPDFFSAFFNASSAEVIIPISPEFNYGFLYFLNTGIVWTSKDTLAPCFEDANNNKATPDQVSIVNGLKEVFKETKGKHEMIKPWEVQIPTSMQILQNKKHLNIKIHE